MSVCCNEQGWKPRSTKTPNPAPGVRGHPEPAPDLPGLVGCGNQPSENPTEE